MNGNCKEFKDKEDHFNKVQENGAKMMDKLQKSKEEKSLEKKPE